MIFSDEYVHSIVVQIENASKNKDKIYFCSSRDIFQARIDSYALGTSKYLESAIIGEIGNNTFDHNWDFAEGHARGTYLNYMIMIILSYLQILEEEYENLLKKYFKQKMI